MKWAWKMGNSILFYPSYLSGEIKAPPSKSDVHRKLICAALANERTRVKNIGTSDDVKATVSCLQSMGAEVYFAGEDVLVTPIQKNRNKEPQLYCKESGATFRFLLPVAAALFEKAKFYGEGRLPKRPLEPLVQAMGQNGVCFTERSLPFETSGVLQSGVYTIPGNVSSQYVSGLLFALPLLKGDSEIRFTTQTESSGYIDMTLQTLEEFSVQIHKTKEGFLIPGGQDYISPKETTAEGDWSGASFFLAVGALGGPVCVSGLQENSLQPDKEVLPLLERFGAKVKRNSKGITVQKGMLQGITIDVAEVPDLVPALAVVAGMAKGETVLQNTARLRLKESDRAKAIQEILQKFGVSVTVQENSIIIEGREKFVSGGEFQNFKDHRIAMAVAIAVTATTEEATDSTTQAFIKMEHPQVVAKSYPHFYEDYKRLGGKVEYV